MKVLLISENTLKQDSLINNNVDSVYLLPAIQVAQDQGLQQIIGSKLYEKICDDIAFFHSSYFFISFTNVST